MAFQPQVNQELEIDGVTYRIAEHPFAPGVPYGQEGRAAVVYQLTTGGDKRALKVFKPRFRLPWLVSLARQLAAYADLPGLQVCRRLVLTPQRNAALLRPEPDLTYAVLMPWINGPTWVEVLLSKQNLQPEQSLALAHAFVEMLARMEQEGLAHCDLSGPNVLLPALAEDLSPTPNHSPLASTASSQVELVDVEQMYGPNLRRPELVTSGSYGYAHRMAPEGLWSADSDRFAGALLLTEMLGWCDERVRDAAWGESYFDPAEMQEQTERYTLLADVLSERWGSSVARLFERAWRSDTLSDCPTFGEWTVALPETVPILGQAEEAPVEQPMPRPLSAVVSPAPEAAPPAYGAQLEAAAGLLAQEAAQRAAQGDLAGALQLYREALSLAPPDSSLGQGIALNLHQLERRVEPTPVAAPTAPAQAHAEPGLPPVPIEEPFAPGEPDIVDVAKERAEVASREATASSVRPAQVKAPPTRAERKLNPALLALPAGLLLLALLAFGLIALNQAQQSATTQAQQTAEAVEAATAEAQAEETRVVERATEEAIAQITRTAVAQITATEEAFIAAGTAQVAAGATARAGVAATEEAQAAETAQAFRASYTALPRSPQAISLENRQSITTLRILGRHADYLRTVAFSPDGQTLAVVPDDRTFRLWHISDGTLTHSFEGHEETVLDVAFSPGGQFIASASYDGVRLWGIDDRVARRTIRGHDDFVGTIAFSPDGRLLATGSGDDTVRVWRVADGTPLLTLTGHTEDVSGVAFSPDGSLIASSSVDGTVRLWQVKDGAPLRVLRLQEGAIRDVAFSPDGQLLASGGEDQTVQLWRVADGAPLHSLQGSQAAIGSLAFSPDGQIVAASASWEHVVRLWRVSDGAELRTLEGHNETVSSVAFSPDGLLLASIGEDGMVRIWGVPAEGEPAPEPSEPESSIGHPKDARGASDFKLIRRPPQAYIAWWCVKPPCRQIESAFGDETLPPDLTQYVTYHQVGEGGYDADSMLEEIREVLTEEGWTASDAVTHGNNKGQVFLPPDSLKGEVQGLLIYFWNDSSDPEELTACTVAIVREEPIGDPPDLSLFEGH